VWISSKGVSKGYVLKRGLERTEGFTEKRTIKRVKGGRSVGDISFFERPAGVEDSIGVQKDGIEDFQWQERTGTKRLYRYLSGKPVSPLPANLFLFKQEQAHNRLCKRGGEGERPAQGGFCRRRVRVSLHPP